MSSIPAVIDRLISLAGQATSALPDAVVTDGWPDALSGTMFGVGADRPPLTPDGRQAQGTMGILTLGQIGLDESFAVPCYIYNGSGDSQKTCRDAVFAVFNPWLELLRSDMQTDPPFAGLCLVAMVGPLTLEGPRSQDEAADGRYALLSFNVQCRNIF